MGTASPRLIAKQLSGAGGYAPGTVNRQLDRPLSSREARALEAALRRTNIFHVPLTCDLGGVDGAEWLVEGVDRTGYHFTKDWSPRHGGVREIGLMMLGLTGWTFKEIY